MCSKAGSIEKNRRAGEPDGEYEYRLWGGWWQFKKGNQIRPSWVLTLGKALKDMRESAAQTSALVESGVYSVGNNRPYWEALADSIKSQITLVQVLTLCDLGRVGLLTALHSQQHRVNEVRVPGYFGADHSFWNENWEKQMASLLNWNSFIIRGGQALSPASESSHCSPAFTALSIE